LSVVVVTLAVLGAGCVVVAPRPDPEVPATPTPTLALVAAVVSGSDVTLTFSTTGGVLNVTVDEPLGTKLTEAAPDANGRVVLTVHGLSPGSHTLSARGWTVPAHQLGGTPSNVLMVPVTIAGRAPMPDLIVTGVSWQVFRHDYPTGPPVWTGSPVQFSATVKNIGDAPTPPGVIINVRFSVDGAEVTRSNAGTDTGTISLAPGESGTFPANTGPPGRVFGTQAFWFALPQTHTVTAWVDDRGVIPESNKNNNKLSSSLPVVGSCSTVSGTPITFTVDNPSGTTISLVSVGSRASSCSEGGFFWIGCCRNTTAPATATLPSGSFPANVYVGSVWRIYDTGCGHCTSGDYPIKEFTVTPGLIVTVPSLPGLSIHVHS
jgi:hypothetical protein